MPVPPTKVKESLGEPEPFSDDMNERTGNASKLDDLHDDVMLLQLSNFRCSYVVINRLL
jgi:uncharacterized protein YutD